MISFEWTRFVIRMGRRLIPAVSTAEITTGCHINLQAPIKCNQLSKILANIAADDPATIAALWVAVETENATQTPRIDTRRVIAAQALAGVANHRPEYFDDIERCIRSMFAIR